MAKKKTQTLKNDKPIDKIPVEDIQVEGVYKTYVGDIIKVLDINKATKTVTLFNITGSFKQWTEFKNVNLIRKIN